MVGSSQRNALVVSIGWWYLKRRIRKRGAAVIAGLTAGEGLSLAGRPRRHPLRSAAVLALIAGAGFLWWRGARSEPVST
jgi:hypothetical protein